MPWWAWLVIGIGLLGVELFLIDAQFYLVFIGASAALVGLLGLIGVPLPDWVQWLVFAVISVGSMFAFRRRIYGIVRRTSGHVEQPLNVGDRVPVPVKLDPGEMCRVEYRGSSWSARNVDDHAIAAGDQAVIANVDGLTLNIKARA